MQQTTNTDPQVTVKTSARWTLNIRDFTKGAIMAGITGGLTALLEAQQRGDIFNPESGKAIGTAALIGLVGYLLKNFATDTKIIEVKDK